MRLLPLIFAAITFVSTGLGGLAAIRFRDRLHLLLGFSSGAILAVALFDILPEIFAMPAGASYMPLAAIGFIAFFGLERYTAMHGAREHVHAAIDSHEQEMGTLSAAGLTFHSFLDGVAIGAGFQSSVQVGLLIALGIIAHDLSDGLNTVTVMLAHGNSLRRARLWLVLDMTAPLFGVLATLMVPLNGVLPWMLAFFAGSFLYIGASDLLPEAKEHDSPLVAVSMVVGMVVIYLTSRLMRGL